MNEEQRQLTLQCAKRIIENHEIGRVVDKYGLEWAREYVANFTAMRAPRDANAAAADPAREQGEI